MVAAFHMFKSEIRTQILFLLDALLYQHGYLLSTVSPDAHYVRLHQL